MENTDELNISKLIDISNNIYCNKRDLLLICIVIDECDEYLKYKIDEKLYNTLREEIRTCYNELDYGDGEYTERVYYDCIDVIIKVIDILMI